MATTQQKPELVVIVGPTASGKSDLALKIARGFSGEIIAADSRTIYKGMDIGTAKASKKEQSLVPHWGLDLVEPGQVFNAHAFKKYAEEKIEDIQSRGELPILVGGTGLYIDAIIFDFSFAESGNAEQREELEKLSTAQLQSVIKDSNYPMPENFLNRRHLIRTIEKKGLSGGKSSIKDNVLIIGLLPPAEELKTRIYSRAAAYFSKGLLQETKGLLEKYGVQALQKTHGIAYAATVKMLKNELKQEEALELVQKQEWQYARRQRTWFKRNKFISWYESPDKAYKEISINLNK
jgi:tRNA dimethylallyltransferase